MLTCVNQIPGADMVLLEKVIIRLAARIKDPKSWPEKSMTFDWKGFKVWAGYTPKGRFRRVAITPPKGSDWTVNLIDANPQKVREADKKVMVYLTLALPGRKVQHYTGQVRLEGDGGRLVWFEDKPQGSNNTAQQKGGDSVQSEIRGFRGQYAFLSNFYPCMVEFEGGVYQSAEAAFQAAKTLDKDVRKQFENLLAYQARELGRRIQLRPDWEQVKVQVMARIVWAKFTQNPDLAAKLLATGDALLVEDNDWGDTFWGVYKGQGENMLGRILMWVRDRLRKRRT